VPLVSEGVHSVTAAQSKPTSQPRFFWKPAVKPEMTVCGLLLQLLQGLPVCLCVFVSVGLCIHALMSPAKMAEQMKMLFGCGLKISALVDYL